MADEKKVLKQDMVAEAIRAGVDKPTAGVAYILERYGVTMTPDTFSQAKKTFAKRAKEAPEPAAPEAPPEPREETRVAAPKRAATPPAAKPSPAELARQVKALVAEHGAQEVAAMLDVFRE